jgi:hypothetical protein
MYLRVWRPHKKSAGGKNPSPAFAGAGVHTRKLRLIPQALRALPLKRFTNPSLLYDLSTLYLRISKSPALRKNLVP